MNIFSQIYSFIHIFVRFGGPNIFGYSFAKRTKAFVTHWSVKFSPISRRRKKYCKKNKGLVSLVALNTIAWVLLLFHGLAWTYLWL